MKEPDHGLKLMSTYGTNGLHMDHPVKMICDKYVDKVTKDFHHPDVVSINLSVIILLVTIIPNNIVLYL